MRYIELSMQRTHIGAIILAITNSLTSNRVVCTKWPKNGKKKQVNYKTQQIIGV
jgi:hypothetical protein